MKKIMMSLCLLSATVALAACESASKGYVDEAPYAMERTAGGMQAAPAEQVFRAKQRK